MRRVKTAAAAVMISMFLLLAGCGGADVRTQTTTTTATTGQELMDLKKAYDSGVITEKEYERKREEILDRD